MSGPLNKEEATREAVRSVRARYRRDKEFRIQLRRDPVAVLRQNGIEVADNFSVNVAETSFAKGVIHLLVYDGSVPDDWELEQDSNHIVPMTSTMINCTGSTSEC